MTATDLSLLTQATVFHNKRAFGQLVVRYQSPVRRFFLNLTGGDSQLSDDLSQDTFVKAYLNIGQFRAASSFKTWLFRIAYNVFYDHCRRKSSEQSVMSTGDYSQGEPAHAGQQHDSSLTTNYALKHDLHQALAILSPAERTCITLQLMEGQPIDKISEITDMAEGTVKSHLSRGKQKMAMYLRKNGYG